jgi:AcrR family transcriptional regulator
MSATDPRLRRPRGHRREEILSVAADLFSQRGYPTTGIDEIGEAAGITGPGVYRHFENKNDVLGEVVLRALARVVESVADVVSEADDEWALLEGLIDNMIRSVMADRAAWAVVVGEQRHLDPDTSRALARAHRLHVEEWVHALSRVRPDLPDAEARVVVHGVLGVVAPFAVRYDAGLGDERLAELLRAMALRILQRTAPTRD